MNATPKWFDEVWECRQMGYFLALRITRNQGDAEDAIQQALLQLVNSGEVSHEVGERKRFLHAVVDAAKSISRGNRRRRVREDTVAMIRTAKVSAPDEYELGEALAKAMDSLDESLRMAVSLRYEQNLSYAEASDILDVTEVTLRKQVSRGLEQLRLALNRRGYATAPSVIIGCLGHALEQPVPPSVTALFEHVRQTGHLPPVQDRPAQAQNDLRHCRGDTVRRFGRSGIKKTGLATPLAAMAVASGAVALLCLWHSSTAPTPVRSVPSVQAPPVQDPSVPVKDALIFFDDFSKGINPGWHVQGLKNAKVVSVTLDGKRQQALQLDPNNATDEVVVTIDLPRSARTLILTYDLLEFWGVSTGHGFDFVEIELAKDSGCKNPTKDVSYGTKNPKGSVGGWRHVKIVYEQSESPKGYSNVRYKTSVDGHFLSDARFEGFKILPQFKFSCKNMKILIANVRVMDGTAEDAAQGHKAESTLLN